MEVLVTETIGLPDDAIVSIRFGTTRRQAPLETVATHPLKFPTSLEAVAEPLKIDILAPIATTRLVLHPSEDQYRIGFEQSDDMLIGLNVKTTSGTDKPEISSSGRPTSATPKFQDAAASARDYLEEHGLLRYVQSLLHAVIQVKPKDPYSFMMEQLGAAQTKTKPKSRPASASAIGRPPTGPPPNRPRPQTANFHGRLQPAVPEEAEKLNLLPFSMTSPQDVGPSEDLATFGARNDVPAEAATTEEPATETTETATKAAAPLSEDLEKLRQELKNAMDKAYATGTLANAISTSAKLQTTADTQKQSEPTPELTATTEDPAAKNGETFSKSAEIQAKNEQSPTTPATTQGTQVKSEETSATIQEVSKSVGTEAATQKTEAKTEETAEKTAKSQATTSGSDMKEAKTEATKSAESVEQRLETGAKTTETVAQQSETEANTDEQLPKKEESVTEAAISSGPSAAEQEVEELRLKMRSLMEKAYESGDLAKAVDATITRTRGPTPEESKTADEVSLDELKSKMCKLLVDAADTGRLESAVKTVAASRSSADTEANAQAPAVAPELQDLKEKIKSLFQDAAESGQLATALESIRSKKET